MVPAVVSLLALVVVVPALVLTRLDLSHEGRKADMRCIVVMDSGEFEANRSSSPEICAQMQAEQDAHGCYGREWKAEAFSIKPPQAKTWKVGHPLAAHSWRGGAVLVLGEWFRVRVTWVVSSAEITPTTERNEKQEPKKKKASAAGCRTGVFCSSTQAPVIRRQGKKKKKDW